MAAKTRGTAGSRPELSVLMTVRDGERHLPEALDTLAAQSFRDYEFIVVDDGSRDSTPAILAARAAADPRMRIVRNGTSLGIAGALNRGLEQCRGIFIARADADDVYDPQRFALQMQFLHRHPAVGVLGTGYRRIYEDGSLQSVEHPPRDHVTIRARQFFSNSFLHPSVIFRADLVRSVGGYDERYWTAQDTDLWVRLRDRTRFANLSEVLVDYRLHEGSTIRTRGAEGRALSLSVPARLLADLLDRPLNRRDVWAAVRLFQAFEPVPAPRLLPAILLLREALTAIGRIVPATAARALRHEAALACLRQLARFHSRDRIASAALLKAALGLDPAVAFRGPFREALARKLTG